jgi:hypothetical protein
MNPFLEIAVGDLDIRSTNFPAAEQADPSWKYINLSQIYILV